MNVTSYDQGFEKGRAEGFAESFAKGFEQGLEQGRRVVLREALEARFGPLPAQVLNRLAGVPAEHLSQLTKSVLHASS